MAYSMTNRVRSSGIETLKILAIMFIIIAHVTQTALENGRCICPINLSNGTENIQYILLSFFFHFGKWGNMLFFICSAWFLLDSSKSNKQKWFYMLIEIWIVSVIIFAIALIFLGGEISKKDIIKSFFPTFFANNWYLTCYLLFYLIHPILNQTINEMSKQTLFRTSAALFVIYFGFSLFVRSFFPSQLIFWVTIYFSIAFVKKYFPTFTSNIKRNLLLFLIGFLGFFFSVLLTNILALHISFFAGKTMHWNVNNNPFIFIMSLAMFNIAKTIDYKNPIVNYFSSFSLLIYIIHENLLLRTYFRPEIINYIYLNYGYKHIAAWVLLASILIFIISSICASAYQMILQKVIRTASNCLYNTIKKIYYVFEDFILSLKS